MAKRKLNLKDDEAGGKSSKQSRKVTPQSNVTFLKAIPVSTSTPRRAMPKQDHGPSPLTLTHQHTFDSFSISGSSIASKGEPQKSKSGTSMSKIGTMVNASRQSKMDSFVVPGKENITRNRSMYRSANNSGMRVAKGTLSIDEARKIAARNRSKKQSNASVNSKSVESDIQEGQSMEESEDGATSLGSSESVSDTQSDDQSEEATDETEDPLPAKPKKKLKNKSSKNDTEHTSPLSDVRQPSRRPSTRDVQPESDRAFNSPVVKSQDKSLRAKDSSVHWSDKSKNKSSARTKNSMHLVAASDTSVRRSFRSHTLATDNTGPSPTPLSKQYPSSFLASSKDKSKLEITKNSQSKSYSENSEKSKVSKKLAPTKKAAENTTKDTILRKSNTSRATTALKEAWNSKNSENNKSKVASESKIGKSKHKNLGKAKATGEQENLIQQQERMKKKAKKNTAANESMTSKRKSIANSTRRTMDSTEATNKTNKSFSERMERYQEDKRYKHVKIPERLMKKWRPLSADNLNFLSTVLESNAKAVMYQCKGKYQADIQIFLDHYKYLLLEVLKQKKLPPSACKNYEKVHKEIQELDELNNEMKAQIKQLEKAISKDERIVTETEKELKSLQTQFESNNRNSDESEGSSGEEEQASVLQADNRHVLELMADLAS